MSYVMKLFMMFLFIWIKMIKFWFYPYQNKKLCDWGFRFSFLHWINHVSEKLVEYTGIRSGVWFKGMDFKPRNPWQRNTARFPFFATTPIVWLSFTIIAFCSQDPTVFRLLANYIRLPVPQLVRFISICILKNIF